MSTLDEWTASVVDDLGVAGLADERTRDLVLDMTKDVAHGVARPAAPLTAYLMGLAVGKAGSADEAAALAARISTLAAAWADTHPRSDDDAPRRGPRSGGGGSGATGPG